MIGSDSWGPIEGRSPHGAGEARLRLHPESAQDIFLAVKQPEGHRRLVVDVPADDGAPGEFARRSQAVRLDVQWVSDAKISLIVELADHDFKPVFDPLVDDIAERVATLQSADEVSDCIVERFESWRDLIRDLADGSLGALRRVGLVGELLCLRKYLLPNLPADLAVASWTGPLAANQDFQFRGGAMEVKTTTAKQPQTLVITNERELDDTGVGALVLLSISLDERRGGLGMSLNELVDAIRSDLGPGRARAKLDELLARHGYLASHRPAYDEPRYTVRSEDLWRVAAGFPRLVESDLPDGVGDVSYRVVHTGLDRFSIQGEQVGELVRGEGVHGGQ